MEDSKRKGNITELDVMAYVTKLDVQVSVPFGDRSRYDQIWDVNGKLLRIQIKTASIDRNDKNTISIQCHSSNRVKGKIVNRRYTDEEVDALVTIFDNKCYYIPISEVPSRAIKLRFADTFNGQQKNIHFAKDYEVETQLSKL